MKTPEVIFLGEPMAEFVRRPGDQTKSGAETYVAGVGGDTSNAAIAAARAGASVGFLTALGADRFGSRILDLWAGEGVDVTHVRRDPDAPTGVYFIEPDPVGRHFTYYRKGSAAARYGPDDVPLDYVRAARVLHFSGITLAVSAAMRDAAFAAAAEARLSGVTVSLDTNLRLSLWSLEEARASLRDAMALARIVVTSIDDSQELNGLTDPDAIIAACQANGPETVVVTMGAKGCRIGHRAERYTVPAVRTKALDSTGAGDSFTGAFLAEWVRSGDPRAAAKCGAKTAAATVATLGALATSRAK